MSNMSSRVKSMKFMQKNFKQDEEEEKKSVKDSSEWQTSSSHKLLSKKDSKIQSVGYASINSFFSVDEPLIPTPRRVYEDEESKIKSQKKVQDLASKEAPIESKPEIVCINAQLLFYFEILTFSRKMIFWLYSISLNVNMITKIRN